MDSSFVPEILVIIEVSEPRLINSYLRKAHQLLFLCAVHLIHLLPDRAKIESIPSPLVRGTQAFQPRPMLVGASSLGLRPSRTSVPLFSRAVVAMELDQAPFTCS